MEFMNMAMTVLASAHNSQAMIIGYFTVNDVYHQKHTLYD